MESLALTPGDHIRSSPLELFGHHLSTTNIYHAATDTGSPCAFFDFVWRNHATPKVRFLSWLLVQNRIQCKANLKKKHVLDNDLCATCGAEGEDINHIISHYPFAKAFWCTLGSTPSDIPRTSAPWEATSQAGFPAQGLSTMFILCR